VPAAPDAYVHRIGRTGRAGREGTAITLADPREHRLLRSIERVTKQKIEVAAVPSVADVRGKRLEQTKASLREQLAAGGLDDVRVVVESLAQEFDVLDVAAAAVKLAHAALTGNAEEPAAEKGAASLLTVKGVRPLFHGRDPNARLVARSRPASFEGARAGRAGDGGEALARLYFAAGRSSGIRPGDLVGAITNEAGLSSKDVGAIQITDRFSLVDVPEALADDVVSAMRRTTLRGQKVQVRRDREGK
jgi:ATP-dependent RNA helicase DeaD